MAKLKQDSEDGGAGEERIAIRGRGGRCFHEVEEMVFSAGCGGGCGYIVDGVLIEPEDVAEMVRLDAQGVPILPSCDKD